MFRLMNTFFDLFLCNSNLSHWPFELQNSTVTDILEGQLEITVWCCVALLLGRSEQIVFTPGRELMTD